MKLDAITRLAFRVIPTCDYKLVMTDLTVDLENKADLFNERGQFVGYDNTTEDTVHGRLVSITKEHTSWVPEGLRASGNLVLVTERNMPIAGHCQVDVRSNWIIETDDGVQYMLKGRRKRGCVYSYLAELICGPECE